MQRTNKRRATIALSLFAVMILSGVAFAAWNSSADGDGEATATTAIDSEITPSDSDSGLYPGAEKTFTVEIDNPNDYPVQVTSISSGSSDAAAGDCAAGTVTSDGASPDVTIEGGGSETFTLTAHMDPDAHDDCQGETFNLPLTAQLVSDAE